MTDTPVSPPTMPGPLGPPRSRDEDHLRILSIFYYVFAGLNAFGGCFGLLYVVLGIVFAANPDIVDDPDAPEGVTLAMGGVMIVVGAFVLAVTLGFAILDVLAARGLQRHRSRTFCLIVAGVSCLSIPFGTTLGIFTFIVLLRPSVERLFAETAVRDASGGGGRAA